MTGGDYGIAADWSLGAIPGGADTADIGPGYTVLFSSNDGPLQVASLLIDGTLILNGNLDVFGSGVTVNGLLNVGDGTGTQVGQLVFLGSAAQGLGGSGTVVFGADGNNNAIVANGSDPLTIGGGLTVHGSNGSIDGSGSVVNQGTIDGDNGGGGPAGSVLQR